MKIISISGLIGSGKDTVGDCLINHHGYTKLSFAAALKDVCAVLFSWDRALLEGSTPESREWREKVDPWWSNRLGLPNLTPRWVLQHFGTQVVRKHFHNDIWVATVERRLLDVETNVVITDCRFPNEIQTLQTADATVVRITRGTDPDWMGTGILAARGDQSAIDQMRALGVHETEWSWLDTKFDIELSNNGTLLELYLQIHNRLI